MCRTPTPSMGHYRCTEPTAGYSLSRKTNPGEFGLATWPIESRMTRHKKPPLTMK